MTEWSSSSHSILYLPEPLFAPLDHNNIRIFFPMLQHCLPSSGSRGSATLPHRLPLRSIPPPRFACGSSHSRGHGRPRSVRKSSRLRWRPCMEDHGKRESQQAPARKATCRKGAASESNLPAGSTIGKQLPAGVIGRMV